MKDRTKVLFLCTGNSCRSQMAEGWTRHFHGDIIDVWSAGIETHGLNPNAVAVMKEAGADISGHRSKNVTEPLDCYRRVRDEIRAFIKDLPRFLENLADGERR
jgi:arsenate reductase